MRTITGLLSLSLLATMSIVSPALGQTDAAPAAVACLGQEKLDTLRYFDIRDQLRYRTDLKGTADLIMKMMERNPLKFAGEADPNSGTIDSNTQSAVKFYREGAQGPQTGSTKTQESYNEQQKRTIRKKIFVPGDDPAHTRKDAILGAEFENIFEDQCDRAFTINMILFIHDSKRADQDSSNGYYFRRLVVKVDWTRESEQDRVQVVEHIQDIPLEKTNFKVSGDIMERKVILEDTGNGITKVFPIGVGAFDIRTEYSMADDLNNTDLTELENRLKLVTSTTDEFPGGSVRDVTSTNRNSFDGANTRSRTSPSYYKARPFIALFDKNERYRSIGMHYSIDSELTRGFVSHGCIRVRDQDLYQLDAIVNEGPQKLFDANFLYDLKGYDHIDHPMPKQDDSYNVKVYSNYHTQEYSALKNNGQSVPNVECDAHTAPFKPVVVGNYHTVADTDCLSLIARRVESTRGNIGWLHGEEGYYPYAEFKHVEHIPLEGTAGQNGDYYQDGTEWNSSGNGGWVDPQQPSLQMRISEAMENRQRASNNWNNHMCQQGQGYNYDAQACLTAQTQYHIWNDELIRLRGY